ncbi:XrtY-associated glycosyltransferase XYAG1 [Pedobacter boryungensis]|uniref:Glycosyltransferase n=1 Tax=Pedobacter boryungensis TaxID=869962 RepID=A0ABX2D824_9SPHI|nr:glycosyltransferase [Pedobacter boryungensis]NQX30164.1 glycosyltransferase [Pedobacter boryungensis]
MSIKILQISAAYKPAYIYGGPTMSVAKLCEVLAENKVHVEVLTTTANGKTELDVNINKVQQVEGVNVTYFKRLTKDHTHFSPTLLLALRSRIRGQQSKSNDNKLIIHIHAWWNLISIFSCQIAKWYNIPVILSPRGMLTNYTLGNRNGTFKSIIHTIMGKKLLTYCHIHATSEKEKQDILQFIQPKSLTVIPNLVELSKNKTKQLPQSFKQEDPFKLIFLSRIEEKKGLELLFESLSGLTINWNLTIAGSGEDQYVKSLKEKAKNLKIQDRIKWIGQVKSADKFKVLADHHLMVLTSYNENFANVVIESLSVGTPVLIANEVGLSDYVKDKKLGWVTSLSPQDIQQNLILAFNDDELKSKIRANAPKIISEDFDEKNLIQKYITFYNQII